MNITEQLIKDFEFKPFQVENTLALFDEGATVPFIARYRKEKTGSLDEIQVRDLLISTLTIKNSMREDNNTESIKSQVN